MKIGFNLSCDVHNYLIATMDGNCYSSLFSGFLVQFVVFHILRPWKLQQLLLCSPFAWCCCRFQDIAHHLAVGNTQWETGNTDNWSWTFVISVKYVVLAFRLELLLSLFCLACVAYVLSEIIDYYINIYIMKLDKTSSSMEGKKELCLQASAN